MSAPTPPRRRWYQFSLRTMFVVVVVVSIPLAWVAHNLNWRSQQEAAYDLPWFHADPFHDATSQPWPLHLPLFYDFGVGHVYLKNPPLGEIERISRLFPEAQIIAVSDSVPTVLPAVE